MSHMASIVRAMVLAACLCTTMSFSTVPLPSSVYAPPAIKSHSSLQATVAPVVNPKDEGKASDKSASTSTAPKSNAFDKFDYNAHWYPVIWAHDLRPNRPTRVTLFDTDYVVARIPKENNKNDIICMQDKCPHKSASLSEGRVTSSGYFQCAYHGWSFDGTNGQCVEIPQVVSDQGAAAKITERACGTAVPAMVVQGMVWLFPGGNLEQALLAPSPPVIKEMDMEGYTTVSEIRDFPVDWTILLENIMDPDHGLFAHGALPFDLYVASKDHPQQIVEESTNNGKGWTITSTVDAVKKMIAFDKARRGKHVKVAADSEETPVATTTFTAPTHVVMGRRDKQTGKTNFITAFWVCPVGTGRSRFMSVACGKVPFLPPRWFFHVNLNNFLDQDTHLLATQQKYVLDAEAKAVKKMIAENGNKVPMNQSTNVRKNNFAYRSPTEKLSVRVGALWDATLNRAPKRVETLLDMENSGAFKNQPSREFVLDRYTQHTQICPDSQDALRNCKRIQKYSKLFYAGVMALKSWAFLTTVRSFALVAMNHASPQATVAGQINKLMKPPVVGAILGLGVVANWLAKKIEKEFYFKYTESLRNRDMDKIPKNWADKQ